MRRILGIFVARWFVTLIGAIAIALLVWFVGPLLAIGDVRPLESEAVRLIIVMVILVGWGALNIFSRVKAAKTNDRMVQALTEAPNDANAAESAAEVAVLRRRLEEALILLRKGSKKGGDGKRRGTRYLYELPWYMFIGPPGSGKTTALRNSGMNFPTAEKFGRDPMTGVGGTRNCDWLFTDEAVMLDTAGRYTTQDSNEAVDQGAWKGFLALLKRYRPRQPINGALVAMGISDIALLSADERAAHGRAIRKRLLELRDEFGIRFPIYMLLTKADLMAGFVEFFDDLGREERDQVWGITLPFDNGQDSTPPALIGAGAEFDALVRRLGDRVLERLQREADLTKRALIFGFPTQVASMKEPLLQFLDEIFAPNRYEGRLLLRGIYFTSGTQEGTPFDRLMGAMAAGFGVERQRMPSFSGRGRSYFLGRLFRDVIFGEASVVGSNPRLDRRRDLFRRLSYGAALAVLVGLGAAWTVSYFGNQALIENVEQRLSAYKKLAEPVAIQTVTDANLQPIMPALASLRGFPVGYDAREQGGPLLLDFGLYQGGKLGTQAKIAYRHALNTMLLPRLLIRLGTQIHDNIGNLDFVQEALKVYLMLGGAGPMDTGEVRTWMVADWNSAFPGAANDTLRRRLTAHLDALLERPLQSIALDGRVIDDARHALQRQSVASRIYNSLKTSAAARRVAPWRIVDHAGPAVDRALALKSGKPLTSGIPGLYTTRGYFDVFLPALSMAAHDAAKEAWVIGNAGKDNDNQTVASGRLEQDVAALYTADYVAQWDRLLGDIQIAPFHSMYEASDLLNILSAPNSPLRLLLVAIARETNLSKPPTNAEAQAGGKMAAMAAPAAAARIERIASTANAAAAPAFPTYGEYITAHFRELHQFVGLGATGPAPIDDVMHSFNDLYLQVNRQSVPGQSQAGLGDGGASARLADIASRLPPPANGLVAAVAGKVSGLTKGNARSQLNDLWRSQVLPFCQSALSGRYPMVHGSPNDATLDDFARLFAPNGLIDAFFKANLAPYVDYSHRPWRWQRTRTADLGLADASLVQFQRADKIRAGFFAGGGTTLLLRLQLTPVSLDAGSTQVTITIDGQRLVYAHGPPEPEVIQWPGKSGISEGRVSFETSGGLPATITTLGPWSLFHLFDAGRVEHTTGADRLRVTFSAEGHEATYDVRANSVSNPLTMRELRDFQCPSHL